MNSSKPFALRVQSYLEENGRFLGEHRMAMLSATDIVGWAREEGEVLGPNAVPAVAAVLRHHLGEDAVHVALAHHRVSTPNPSSPWFKAVA